VNDTEIRRIQREKYNFKNWPSHAPAARRKCKLRMRYAASVDAEITRTEEKLRMLKEIRDER